MTTRAAVAAAERIAAEVRAELARQRKTAGDLAAALGITPHTAGRRLTGEVPFNVLEIEQIAAWLEVPSKQLYASVQAAS